MSQKKTPTGNYEIGYCRPPKAHQFKRRRKAVVDSVDAMAVLGQSVTVTKNGVAQQMSAYEVAMRASVKKAIKDPSVTAILHVLAIAEKHGLLTVPPEPFGGGGVLIVPGRLAKEDWEEIFNPPNGKAGKPMTTTSNPSREGNADE